MEKELRVLLNENGEVSISKEIIEVTSWATGETIKVDYVDEKDVLVLQRVSDTFILNDDCLVPIPQEIMDEGNLFINTEFTADYIDCTDALLLYPSTKICIMCEDEQVTFRIGKGKYICDACINKLVELKKS